MKKLLLVLMVVAMASFLFVGCLPGTTTPTEPTEPTEPTTPEICPTVAVTSQVAVGSKTYIKTGTQTITVTFAVPTEPVSVFVGEGLKTNPEGVPDGAAEVVMYPDTDKKVYTGTFKFVATTDCDTDYIYVTTCDTCAACKYPYVVDKGKPSAIVKVTAAACACEGCAVKFASTTSGTCVTTDNCSDACSGLTFWGFDVYSKDPFDTCCLVPCEAPIFTCSGTACPILCTTSCLGPTDAQVEANGHVTVTYYIVETLADAVGNTQKYYATVKLDSRCVVVVTEYKDDGVDNACSTFDTPIADGNTNIIQ